MGITPKWESPNVGIFLKMGITENGNPLKTRLHFSFFSRIELETAFSNVDSENKGYVSQEQAMEVLKVSAKRQLVYFMTLQPLPVLIKHVQVLLPE